MSFRNHGESSFHGYSSIHSFLPTPSCKKSALTAIFAKCIKTWISFAGVKSQLLEQFRLGECSRRTALGTVTCRSENVNKLLIIPILQFFEMYKNKFSRISLVCSTCEAVSFDKLSIICDRVNYNRVTIWIPYFGLLFMCFSQLTQSSMCSCVVLCCIFWHSSQ